MNIKIYSICCFKLKFYIYWIHGWIKHVWKFKGSKFSHEKFYDATANNVRTLSGYFMYLFFINKV